MAQGKSALITSLFLVLLVACSAKSHHPPAKLVISNAGTGVTVNGISLGMETAALQMNSGFELVKGDPSAVIDRTTGKRMLYLAEADGKIIGLYSRVGTALYKDGRLLFEVGSEAATLDALPADFKKAKSEVPVVYEDPKSKLSVFVKSGRVLEFQYLLRQ